MERSDIRESRTRISLALNPGYGSAFGGIAKRIPPIIGRTCFREGAIRCA